MRAYEFLLVKQQGERFEVLAYENRGKEGYRGIDQLRTDEEGLHQTLLRAHEMGKASAPIQRG